MKEKLTKLLKDKLDVIADVYIETVLVPYLIKNGIIAPPCKVGDTIYTIPSQTNYNLNLLSGHTENNILLELPVKQINIYENDYMLVTDISGGYASGELGSLYKDTWFLSKDEAEKALIEREKNSFKNNSPFLEDEYHQFFSAYNKNLKMIAHLYKTARKYKKENDE